MSARGAHRFLWKPLSPNDNSKNQIYLAGNFSVMNAIPAGAPIAATSGSRQTPIFRASVRFAWIDDLGEPHEAPGTQMILYPQYPEVRLSGFLQRASWSPSEVMASRDEGRILVLGVAADGRVLAFAAAGDSSIARELTSLPKGESVGALRTLEWTTDQSSAARQQRLLDALCRVSAKGWIRGWRLLDNEEQRPCTASNCVGVTLESELGIRANSVAGPDIEGWEVKAHSVASLSRVRSGVITLMTPEPTGGFYRAEGVERFVERYGYADTKGRQDRRNFGGIHKVGVFTARTKLKLELNGYDIANAKLVDTAGSLTLIDADDRIAAAWSFSSLLKHWSKKHMNAVYVPALMKKDEHGPSYQFGANVLCATGTDYLKLLRALANGAVYLDPGIKVVTTDGRSIVKRRNQFRTGFAKLSSLYDQTVRVSSCTES